MNKKEFEKVTNKMYNQIARIKKEIEKIQQEYATENSKFKVGDRFFKNWLIKYEVNKVYYYNGSIWYECVEINKNGKKRRWTIDYNPYYRFSEDGEDMAKNVKIA